MRYYREPEFTAGIESIIRFRLEHEHLEPALQRLLSGIPAALSEARFSVLEAAEWAALRDSCCSGTRFPRIGWRRLTH